MFNNRIFTALLALTWIALNAWASQPVLYTTLPNRIVLASVFLTNPLVFGYVAWKGWKTRCYLVSVLYPLLVVLTWRVALVIGLACYWGRSEWLWPALFQAPTKIDLIYLVLCGTAYAFGALAWIAKNQYHPIGEGE